MEQPLTAHPDPLPRTPDAGATLLALDIGGTAVKIALIRLDGERLARAERPVDFDGYRTPILSTCLEEAERFLREEGGVAGPKPLGIAISATGQIDSRQGLVAGTCGNLPGWVGSRLGEAFHERFGLPVTVANDANCMLLGEAWKGAASGLSHVVGLTLGTGVGGGLLVEGKLLEGQRGLAGELGHLPLMGTEGERCTCGLPGCYERYASTSALLRGLRAEGFAYDNARALCGDLQEGQLSVPSPLPGAEGLAAVETIFRRWRSQVALGIAGLIHLFNPEAVLVGGGISAQHELLIEPLREEVFALIMPEFRRGLRISAAQLKNDAGLIGAAAYFLQKTWPEFLKP